MNSQVIHRHPARGRHRITRGVLLAVALSAGWAAFAQIDNGAEATRPAAAAPAPSVVSAGLPEEFRAIRPAGLDGTPPPIPPAETWPAP